MYLSQHLVEELFQLIDGAGKEAAVNRLTLRLSDICLGPSMARIIVDKLDSGQWDLAGGYIHIR